MSKTAEEFLKKEQIDDIDLIIGNTVLLSYPPQIPSKKLSKLLEEYAKLKTSELEKENQELKRELARYEIHYLKRK